MIDRSTRERMASDESNVYEEWHKLRERYRHIYQSPNTRRFQQALQDRLQQEAPGKRVLEIGCGGGGGSHELALCGAASVLGMDISHSRIAYAQAYNAHPACTFVVMDVSHPIEGSFDLIFGRAVLHHLDYQEVLQRLYHDNLNPGGMMIFSEPLGENLLLRLFRYFSKHAHTDDERAFDRHDLAWIQHTFAGLELLPCNYLTIPLGALSSLICRSPENWLLRIADRIDVYLTQHAPWLHLRFRYAALVIQK